MNKGERHTLQYAGSVEDVEKIKELAENFAERKKIHNKYKIKNVAAEMIYINEARTMASVAMTWEFEDEAHTWPFIRRLYRYLELRMTGSADGGFSRGDNAATWIPLPLNASTPDVD